VVPHGVAAAIGLALVVVASGAIHLDGFLDGCDAFFATVPVERRHAILKDPACGSFALAGLLVAGSLWYAALAALPPGTYPIVFAFTGALARAAAIGNALIWPPARPAGLAARALETKPQAAIVAAEWIVLAVAGYAISPLAALLVPLALLIALGLGRWIAGRLGGGLVGDAYGFTIVLLEVALTVVLSALLSGAEQA
jgi:adenosylcobinamide-GDP ribazoletransferase